jgi:hypothetical protein
MTELVEKETRNTQTRKDEITLERGLMALAERNGNSRKAAKDLKADGIEVCFQTLWNWSRQYEDRYQAIRAQVLPKIRAKAADQHMDLAQRLMKAESEMVDQLQKKIPDIEPRDLPGSIRNTAVSAAVHTEKAQLLNDQPTQRVSIDLPATLKELKSLGVDPATVLDLQPVSEETVEPRGDHKQPHDTEA